MKNCLEEIAVQKILMDLNYQVSNDKYVYIPTTEDNSLEYIIL